MNHIVNSRSGEELSLWDWLGSARIKIPMMQRDYAQGRKGLHYLRERFLQSVFDILKPGNKDDLQRVKLDFVYGKEEDVADDSGLLLVTPIDGQQRLTSLWLLYWYVAMRSGKLIDSLVIERLQRFTYDMRTSSRKFCESLVANGDEIEKLRSRARIGVVEAIRRQTWYCNSWDYDPTVVGMLMTLSGDSHAPNSCKDGIEKHCEGIRDVAEFQDIWKHLVSEPSKCPITFYFQSLDGIGDANGLYVKMNARGKSLTAFENFKAELSDFAIAQVEHGQDAKVWSDVPLKLDTSWSDIFWTAPDDGVIGLVGSDDRYLAFIKRLVFNDIVTQKIKNEYQVGNDVKGFSEELRDSTDFYHFFEGRCVYDSFRRYGEAFSRFPKIKSVLDFVAHTGAEKVAQLIEACTPVWFRRSQSSWLDRLCFVPGNTDFVKDGPFWKDTITQSGRVWFLSIARFFELALETDAEVRKAALTNWLRVVANIIENADINTMGSMISTMRLIDELSSHSTAILEFLSDPNNKIESGASAEQVKEEREKAERIKASPEDIKCITEAEGELFNKGMIRYLYRKDGNPDWKSFELRREKMRQLFRENGSAMIGTVSRFASGFSKGGLLKGFYKSISFIPGNSQRTSAGWKRIFRDMHDKNRGGGCRRQLENFIDGVDVPEKEDVISLLVEALTLMEREGSGLQTLVTRVLTKWNAKVGEKDIRLYDYVLTDYANRQQRPNNGLFVDLCGTEDEMKTEIARYGRYRGAADDVNDEKTRQRNTDRYYFNGDHEHKLYKNELVRAIALKYVADNPNCTEEQFYERFPRDLKGRYGIAIRPEADVVNRDEARWYMDNEYRLHLANCELVVSNQWGTSPEFDRVILIARQLGYTIDVVPKN